VNDGNKLAGRTTLMAPAAAHGESAMCTRVLWNTNDIAVLFGRTMDWPECETVEPYPVIREGFE